jgi:predicted small metal-binding protein
MANKVLRCGDIMPGCDKVIEGKSEDEVFAKAEEHARKEHNMTFILPSTMNQIGAAIRDKT